MACLLGAAPVYLVNIISGSGIHRELNHHYSIPILGLFDCRLFGLAAF